MSNSTSPDDFFSLAVGFFKLLKDIDQNIEKILAKPKKSGGSPVDQVKIKTPSEIFVGKKEQNENTQKGKNILMKSLQNQITFPTQVSSPKRQNVEPNKTHNTSKKAKIVSEKVIGEKFFKVTKESPKKQPSKVKKESNLRNEKSKRPLTLVSSIGKNKKDWKTSAVQNDQKEEDELAWLFD